MSASSVAARGMGLPERRVAWVVGIVAAVATIFWSTSASMVAVWNSSGTYSHGYFIVPAFLWLVWGRRHELARLSVAPSWWALPLLATAGAVWLVGNWMALAQPAQFAIVAMVPLAMACVLGFAWVRALAFPLVFLLFAVPFGESLVPVLMDWTADFTVVALRLSGVPVYRDGLHFDIPSGKWSVVDSCSGIRYLFACLAVSSLYAWTIYRTTTRRLIFVGLSAVIAVVANWVRAYGIVMLGHLSNNQIATGADHLVYGGIFFAVIMALVFGLGAVWPERAQTRAHGEADSASVGAKALACAADSGARRGLPAALATIAVMLIAPLAGAGSAWPSGGASFGALELQARGGWVRLDEPVSTWQPVFHNPARVVTRSFGKDKEAVGVHIGVFHRPTAKSKLTSGLNRLLEPDGQNLQWKLAQQGSASIVWASGPATARTAVLIGKDARLLAWQWYWVDGQVTADPVRAAWQQLLAGLRGRGGVSAWFVVYTRDTGDPEAAARALENFVTDMSTSIDSMLRRPGAHRVVPNRAGS